MGSVRGGMNDGQWRHFVFVRRGQSLEIYINGTLDSTLDMLSLTSFSNTNDLYLMGRESGVQAVTGSADEVAFYDYALEGADIYQHYLQGQEANIAKHWRGSGESQFAKAMRGTDYLAVTRFLELPTYEPLHGIASQSLFKYGEAGTLVTVEDFSPSAFSNAPAAAWVGQDGTRISVDSPDGGQRFIRTLPSGYRSGLIPVTGGSLNESWTYSYDAVSNITGIVKPGGSDAYGYDDLDRLDSYTLPGSSAVTYGYDAVGNRLSETESGVTQNHTYGTTSNRHLTQAGSALTYDANGNRLTDQGGSRTFAYNHRNRISSLTDGSGTLGTYLYNALGQRVNKVAGSSDIDYVYDLHGQLIGEYANGVLIKEYVYLASTPIAQIDATSVTYLHSDHLGTPREATDANAQVVWRWDSDPFGDTSPNEDPDGDLNTVTINLRFPGQYFDSESDLDHNYFRTYDPTIGRYTQSDPRGTLLSTISPERAIAETMGVRVSGRGIQTQLFGYADLNPLIFQDPTGEAAQYIVPAVIGGFVIWAFSDCVERCYNEEICDDEVTPGKALSKCTKRCAPFLEFADAPTDMEDFFGEAAEAIGNFFGQMYSDAEDG